MNFSRSPICIFHIPISFKDPDAKYFPSGEYDTLFIQPEWPLRIFKHSPVYTFQIPIVLSLEPDARYSPFGENSTLHTEDE